MEPIVPNRAYDKLKWVALIALPAVTAFYAIFGDIWDFPRTDEVVKTLIAFDTLLGALLGISSKQYNSNENRFAGQVDIVPGDEPESSDLLFSITPHKVAGSKEIVLKVNDKT